MANLIKPKKQVASSVGWGDSTEVDKRQLFLKELESVVQVTHLMCSDAVTFKSYCGIYFGNSLLDEKYYKFIKEKIELAYGCNFPDELFNQPIKNGCDYLQANRKNNPIIQPKINFLGIKGLKELFSGEFYNLTHSHTLREHVDYFSGYIKGKSVPLNGSEEMKQSIMDDFNSMKESVYGTDSSYRWEIKTDEGDLIRFKNHYEVCCWMVARASNYDKSAFTKENW